MGLGFTAEVGRGASKKELSDAAAAVMLRGFAAGWTAERIAQAVADESGEKVSARTIARRAAEWRESKRRFDAGTERWKQLLAAAQDSPADVSGMIQALAKDYLLQNPNALDGADPIKMGRAALVAQELELKRRQVEVKERAVAIDERRVKLLEEREQRAIAALGDDKQQMTAEERLAEIKAIYGLRN